MGNIKRKFGKILEKVSVIYSIFFRSMFTGQDNMIVLSFSLSKHLCFNFYMFFIVIKTYFLKNKSV